VGTETFPREFSRGDETESTAKKEIGFFYGSSYVAAPDGSRTPGLGRVRDGILLTEVDLNLCQQAEERWDLRASQRLELYAESLARACKLEFKPEIVQ